jgi:hypothetical protein
MANLFQVELATNTRRQCSQYSEAAPRPVSEHDSVASEGFLKPISNDPLSVFVAFIGDDNALHWTRRQVLRSAGYCVGAFKTLEELELFAVGHSSLCVILSEDVDTRTARIIAARMKQRTRGTVLRFAAPESAYEESRFFRHVFAPAIVTPVGMLAKVKEVLSCESFADRGILNFPLKSKNSRGRTGQNKS